MKPVKSERLSLRLDEKTKQKIELAATICQSSINSFILKTAIAAADEIIQHHETITLNDLDRDKFFDVLLNPPTPNSALKEILGKHSQMIDSDV